ncbi:MAG: nuclear transport factor 2 family protein [Bacteroidota bacterium]|nr:nuclear transport factor 2 family protein [Bacteroidota bacterium]
MSSQIDLIKRFFQLLQWFTTSENEFKSILHPEIEQTEFPNVMMPMLRQRRFKNIIEGAEAGKKMLAYQRFEPTKFYEAGDTVIVEFTWTGELKTRVGRLNQGQMLKAHICSIFEFRDGKIFRQRNYDCYVPIKTRGWRTL